jgi:GAF domain-containing protein
VSEVLAVSSLARAVSGNGSISDVGALSWMTLRSVVPAASMALFVEDQQHDVLTVAYAAGTHAAALRQIKKGRGSGIAGWAAVNRRGVLNADPALDLGQALASLEPPLRSSVTVPLAHDGRVVGVLSCYASTRQGFTEDHLRLLELLAASLAAAVASVSAPERTQRPAASGARRGANVLVMTR